MFQPSSLAVDIALVRRALRLPLPGGSAQVQMSPRPRAPGPYLPTEYRDGGVLLLLYPLGVAELAIVLTRRCANLAAHAGQISFPGGLREPEDGSLAETAWREAREELGLAVEDLEFLGSLTPLDIPVTGYRIHPYVAYTPRRPAFRPDPREVAEVLEVPLAYLLDPLTVAQERWTIRGQETEVPFYQVGAHKVWGATAMVLSEFLALLRLAQTES